LAHVIPPGVGITADVLVVVASLEILSETIIWTISSP
jgi:hypothetical protein